MINEETLTRHIAVEIFSAVLRNAKGLEEEFAAKMAEQDKKHPLETRDRTFIRLLVTTTLRRLGQIDNILARYLKKPLPERAAYVLDALRLSTAQLVFLNTPPHAAVSTGVSLVKSWGIGGFAGLANAVLRRISTEGKEIAASQNAPEMNIPSWLLRVWEKTFGKKTAYLIAEAGLQEAPLDFSVKQDPEKWAEKLEATVMPTGTLRRAKSASVPSLPGFEDGEWWVQDLSAALPAKLLKDIEDKRVIDICAAPGGKTAQLVMAGAEVTALDISANRLKRLTDNMNRLKMSVEIITADARKWWAEEGGVSERFDAVLLDAPCSATGTLRRHPDVVWHRTPEDILRLNKAQKELLVTALDMLDDGGELVYCVCSLLPSEGVRIIDAAVEKGLAERIPVTKDEVPDFMITPKGDLCVLPLFYKESGGCDGFYAARLRKKGA